ncbi:hypothetical protein RRU01S_15_01000 [Agrobacterium rubi TR3 = NBRC 13261]|uniref:Uncharacterized protein n=1 Tax=Agrobacterium rubi TR3 = NBRC 13261 TaxID=1368415 RepID=A0A081CWX9_9HYPH|nr:hypothetical protein [Agrobacterium rubi]MBP1878143.1 hypothetical protein [Agrobacterium rubi]GAK71175.1 hypothetical protein RRU01S_15_01000 [Agrobacterium rubi TR3 = NBRC 13261]
MKIKLSKTVFITLNDDGSITQQSESSVAIPGLPEIQIHGFGAVQDWLGVLLREGRSDLIEAVQRLLNAAEGDGGAK